MPESCEIPGDPLRGGETCCNAAVMLVQHHTSDELLLACADCA